jgi:ATP-dependent RNA helicase DHX37/DHR1
MHALTDVTGKQLAALAARTPLLHYGKPVKETDVRDGGKVRDVYAVPYMRAEQDGTGMGWPLPMRKVTQHKTAAGWEVV